MEVVLPAIAWLCLAALIVLSPHVGPRRVRRQAAVVAASLCAQHSFTDAPEVGHVWPTSEPPCHYGTDRTFADVVTGAIAGLPVTSATYTCRYNGSTHLYGMVAVTLNGPAERVEIRHGRVFETAWARSEAPDGATRSGDQAFDAVFELYFPDRDDGAMGLLTQSGISVLLRVDDRFSLRLEDRRLLLWRRDGWTSAESVAAAVRAAQAAVDSVRLVG